jgi:methylated-DNA-[protein]-cysteine S-methyltransferase
MSTLSWACLSTPVGEISVGCSAAGVTKVRFGSPPADANQAEPDMTEPDKTEPDKTEPDKTEPDKTEPDKTEPGKTELARAARQQLAEYFGGRRTAFDLPLDWSATSGTQRDVLQMLAGTVGYGQTTSYGALAARAGLSADDGTIPARAVGQIMGSNPIPVIVPCHRVLASDGLGGYSGGAGIEVKRWLLIREGALPPTLDWQPAEQPDRSRGG